jgi:tetratricopeptide (TPR) repeat protein
MTQTIQDIYKLFEVVPGCSDEELRTSYRRLLLRWHPDQNPGSIEAATSKTLQLLAGRERLTEWRRMHPTNPGEPVDEGEREAAEEVVETEGAAFSFFGTGRGTVGVSLGRIAELKQELRDAWAEFSTRQYDVKAALRLVRAALQGGRPDVVDDLLRNSKLVDAAPILADMYPVDEAAQIALIWAQRLRDSHQCDLAIELLQDITAVAGLNSLTVAGLKDTLRSIHYGIAQGHGVGQQKPSPATRIVHLRAIVKLGFKLGYIYKLLAEALFDMGDEDGARSNLQHALAVDPQLTGAITIMRALGLLSEAPRRKDRRPALIKYVYTRPEQVPSVSTIVGWFEHQQWEQIIAHADTTQYSPRILPSARWSLDAMAAVLGECNDAGAVSSLLPLLDSVYWNVRRTALLAIAKIGGEPELARLRRIRQEQGENDKFVVEPAAYAEARLTSAVETIDDEGVVQAAQALLRTYSYKQSGELGRMRWRLERVVNNAADARRIAALSLLAEYCLQMHDWTRVLTLLGVSALPARLGDRRSVDFHVAVAAAFVLGGVQSAALGWLHPVYEQMPQQAQQRADEVLWDALQSPGFIGSPHYTWALRIILKSAVSAANPGDLLSRLHRLARVMEPIGDRDMGVWLRHILRAEGPGHYYGDPHDRLNYFGPPLDDVELLKEVRQACEEYKPQIRERLRAVLGGDSGIPVPVSGHLISD